MKRDENLIKELRETFYFVGGEGENILRKNYIWITCDDIRI